MPKTFLMELEDNLKNKNIRVASFDFFDTLVSRRAPRPIDVFYVLGRRLADDGMFTHAVAPERFVQLRQESERRAREAGSSVEISLVDIYEQFPSDLVNVGAKRLAEAEFQIESEFVFPVAHMVEMVKLAAKRGKKVVVVSDTYFSSKQIKLLWGDATPEVDITFFASCEHKCGKYDKLFDVVLKKLGVKGSEVTHAGDNYHADIECAKKRGIVTSFLPHGSGYFWTKVFNKEVEAQAHFAERLDPRLGDLGMTALRCKAALSFAVADIDRACYIQYGAQVLGPALSLFIHWVRANVIEQKVDVVMPLMREGFMINKLLKAYGDDMNVTPAYLSRRILFQASLTVVDENALRQLRFGNLESTVEDYLGLIGLFISDVPSLAEFADESIGNNNLFGTVINAVIKSPARLVVEGRARSIRQGVIRHFVGLATVDGKMAEHVAVVDVGWNGTIQRLLQKILKEEGINTRVTGLYMMTTPAVNQLAFDGVIARGFFVDGGLPESDFRLLSRTLEIFEQSCAPSHGTVLSHDLATGEPHLMPDRIPAHQRADIDDIQTGMVAFHDIYMKNFPQNISVGALSALSGKVRPILRRAMVMPTQEEAALFSLWVHDDNLASGGVMPILGAEETRSIGRYKTFQQYMDTPMNDLYWPAGAMAVSDPDMAAIMSHAVVRGQPLEQFDVVMGISSELATDKNGCFNTGKKYAHPVMRNAAGRTYLRFDAHMEGVAGLRWTPSPVPFEMRIDFILLTHRAKDGRVTRFRIEGRRMSRYVMPVGMKPNGQNSWQGAGSGCAFYFSDLRTIGVAAEGTLTFEVACAVNSMASMGEPEVSDSKSDSLMRVLPAMNGAQIREGSFRIESMKGGEIDKTTSTVKVNKDGFSIVGWMVDPEAKQVSGDFFARLSNQLGESFFVPMQQTVREDVANHFDNKDLGQSGFALSDCKIPVGVYSFNILRANEDSVLIGKEAFRMQAI